MLWVEPVIAVHQDITVLVQKVVSLAAVTTLVLLITCATLFLVFANVETILMGDSVMNVNLVIGIILIVKGAIVMATLSYANHKLELV